MQKRIRYLFRQMAAYLGASIGPYDSLLLIEKKLKNKDKKLKKIIGRILGSLAEGLSVSAAFEFLNQEHMIDSISFSILKSAEKSGNLQSGFKKISDHLEYKSAHGAEFLSRALYPVIVCVSSAILVYLLVLLIFPKILPLFASLKVPVPRTTSVVLTIVQFISKNTLYVVIILALLHICFSYLYRKNIEFKTRIHRYLISIPVLGKILFAKDSAQACYSISVLMKSNFPISEAIVAARSDLFAEPYRHAFILVEEHISVGKNISESFSNNKYFKDSEWPDFMLIGERTGMLPQAFEDLGKIYQQEIKRYLESINKLVEPLLLLFVASVVLFVALSVVQPMYSIIQYVNP